MIQGTLGSESMRTRDSVMLGLAATALVGCHNQPLSLTGTWRGANAKFADVTLVLQQTGDSLSGTIALTFTGYPTPVTTRVSGRVDRDSLDVSGPLQPSTGWSSLGFAGRVFVGITSVEHSNLIGHVLLSGTPEPAVINLHQ